MSQSIFHVRPLDSGKGWAIDEYDGRGAWQRSVPIGPDGAPMDKIQAQRAVFQLRRKAVNSAPKGSAVNKPACGTRCPGEPSWICRRELGHYGRHESANGGDWHDDPAEPNWENLEREVVERIRALAVVFGRDTLDMSPELRAKTWNELALPNLRLLAEFCTSVTLSDAEDEREPLTDNTGCDV